MRVDDGDNVPLCWLVRDVVGGDQALEEPGKPRVPRIERTELLKQVLGSPVARVAEHVSLDAIAQTSFGADEPVERVVQHPQSAQELMNRSASYTRSKRSSARAISRRVRLGISGAPWLAHSSSWIALRVSALASALSKIRSATFGR